jgi:hypothetical protein
MAARFRRKSGSRLLKWLNSLYRPGVAGGNPRRLSSRTFSGQSVGASPSGKAVDFDSTMRRFEPSRPSQPFRRSARLPKKSENGPEMPAFRAFDLVSRLRNRQSLGRQSAKVSGHTPEYSRFAETVGGDGVRSRLPRDHVTRFRPDLRSQLRWNRESLSWTAA